MSTWTYSDDGPECPYCGRQFTPDESFYYDALAFTEMNCDECGEPFKVEVHHSVSWRCGPMPELPIRAETDPLRKAAMLPVRRK
jgi:predicted amidophosphoribosyltransferase